MVDQAKAVKGAVLGKSRYVLPLPNLLCSHVLALNCSILWIVSIRFSDNARLTRFDSVMRQNQSVAAAVDHFLSASIVIRMIFSSGIRRLLLLNVPKGLG